MSNTMALHVIWLALRKVVKVALLVKSYDPMAVQSVGLTLKKITNSLTLYFKT